MYRGISEKGSGDVGSTDCVQRDRYEYIVYLVSQSADSNPFRGTAGNVQGN